MYPVHSSYVHPEGHTVYNVDITDYFLFARYYNMNTFFYFWFSFYTMFLCRRQKSTWRADAGWTFLMTMLTQSIIEVLVIFTNFPSISTSHDPGDQLICLPFMTILGIVVWYIFNYFMGKIPAFVNDKESLLYDIQIILLTLFIYVATKILEYIGFTDERRFEIGWNPDVFLYAFIFWTFTEIVKKWNISDIKKWKTLFPAYSHTEDLENQMIHHYNRTYNLIRTASILSWCSCFYFWTFSFAIFLLAIVLFTTILILGAKRITQKRNTYLY